MDGSVMTFLKPIDISPYTIFFFIFFDFIEIVVITS